MKKIIALIFACAFCFLMISCAKKNEGITDGTTDSITESTTATATSTEIMGTTAATEPNGGKNEIRLAAPKVVFVTGGKEYECTYSEKASSTVVGDGTSAVFCGRAILGGFKRQTLVGKIPEISIGDISYITSDDEYLEYETLNLYNIVTNETKPDKANISELSDKIKGGNYIAELFVTKNADDSSSVTYAFYMLLKG